MLKEIRRMYRPTDTALRLTCLEVCHVHQEEKHTVFHVNYIYRESL